MLPVYHDEALRYAAVRVGVAQGGFDVLESRDDTFEGGGFWYGSRVGGETYCCREGVGDGADVGGGGDGAVLLLSFSFGVNGSGDGGDADGLWGWGHYLF